MGRQQRIDRRRDCCERWSTSRRTACPGRGARATAKVEVARSVTHRPQNCGPPTPVRGSSRAPILTTLPTRYRFQVFEKKKKPRRPVLRHTLRRLSVRDTGPRVRPHYIFLPTFVFLAAFGAAVLADAALGAFGAFGAAFLATRPRLRQRPRRLVGLLGGRLARTARLGFRLSGSGRRNAQRCDPSLKSTNSMMHMSAASPRRKPVFRMRV